MTKRQLLQWLKRAIDYTRYDPDGDLAHIPHRFQWMPPFVWELLLALVVLALVVKIIDLMA